MAIAQEFSFGSPSSEAEIDRLADVLSHGFGFPRDDARPWFERAGAENVRALRRGKDVIGGLLQIPMGQFFGGASIPTMGVAGVGIAVTERGQGAGTELMTRALREARAQGMPLSTLYPATLTLYRRAGYERAGACFDVELDPRACDVARERDVVLAEVEGTPDELRALYKSYARHTSGFLDRGPYVWARVSHPRAMTTKTFTVSVGSRLEGYVVVAHKTADGTDTTVNVIDMAAITPRAAHAVLRLLVEYRSVATRITWSGGPADVFTSLLPERHYTVCIKDYFMLRIVDVAKALSARGYPQGVAGAITLEVLDTSLPENSGVYTLTLDGGVGRVTTASSQARATPRARITERGLAALYTGHGSPHVLAQAGWLETDHDDALAHLTTWFAGPYPTMRDKF